MSGLLPCKLIVERAQNLDVGASLEKRGLEPWMASLLSRRLETGLDLDELLSPSLSKVADPSEIPSMDQAVDRIVEAIQHGQRIALACDHDMDGTASAAVLWTALTQYFGVPPENLRVVTSHRLREGYGLTSAVVARIIEWQPNLVITADKGSTDEPRIAVLASNGIDVIVTDHHQVSSSGPPPSAYAVVNPARSDSRYDPHVCGAGVAFLVMAKVRSALIRAGLRPQIATLSGLLDYVAVATIADCVSLSPTSSSINRTFVRRGLELLNGRVRPCWEAFQTAVGTDSTDAEAVAFRLVPAIAAAGRLDWADVGFRFLISQDVEEAEGHWGTLQRENEQRKKIERALRERAIEQARKLESQSIILFFEDGHAGVHGITASRLVESFGKPIGIFAPRGSGARDTVDQPETAVATGSFRSVPGLNIHEVISAVARAEPDLVVSHGGHHGAAGAVVPLTMIERFAAAFEREVRSRSAGGISGPVVHTDGALDMALHTVAVVKAIDQFGPWGRGFDYPMFLGEFTIRDARFLSDGKHVRLNLTRDGSEISAVWFSVDEQIDVALLLKGSRWRIAYRLKINQFRGKESAELLITTGESVG